MHVEHSRGAVRTAQNIQVDGRFMVPSSSVNHGKPGKSLK